MVGWEIVVRRVRSLGHRHRGHLPLSSPVNNPKAKAGKRAPMARSG